MTNSLSFTVTQRKSKRKVQREEKHIESHETRKEQLRTAIAVLYCHVKKSGNDL